MPPTTRSREKKPSIQTQGSDHNDKATVHLLKGVVRSGRQVAPSKQVGQAMQDGGGYLFYKRPLTMSQTVSNQWSVYRNCDNGWLLRFFTPGLFKNVEGICWNARPFNVAFPNETNGVGANLNLPAYQKTFVKDSSATFRFKNVSQHQTILEMYICYGNVDTNYTLTAIHPIDEYPGCNQSYYVGNAAALTCNSLGANIMSNPKFLQKWRTERVTFKFEPGEGAFYKLQGPKNYVMDGAKHVLITQTATDQNPALFCNPDTKGNGCYVWFRVLNDLTLLSGSTGDNNANLTGVNPKGGLGHPPHRPWAASTAFGAITCEIDEKYVIGRPEVGTTVAQGVNRHYLSALQSISGAVTDVQVDADNSAVIPTAPA